MQRFFNAVMRVISNLIGTLMILMELQSWRLSNPNLDSETA